MQEQAFAEVIRQSLPYAWNIVEKLSNSERHFNVKLAFQNCHNLAAFRRDRLDSAAYSEFVSINSQILNQTPGFKDC